MSNDDNSETASERSVSEVHRVADHKIKLGYPRHQPTKKEATHIMLEPVQLTQFGVTELEAQHALNQFEGCGMSGCRSVFQDVRNRFSMEEGIVKHTAKSVSQGVGVRATAGEKTGFAYSDELTKQDLEIAADTARYIANINQGRFPRFRAYPTPGKTGDLYPVERAKAELPTAGGVTLLNEIDAEARRGVPRIKNVMASFNTEYKVVAVATTDGALVGGTVNRCPICKLPVWPRTRDNRQVGSFGGGGPLSSIVPRGQWHLS